MTDGYEPDWCKHCQLHKKTWRGVCSACRAYKRTHGRRRPKKLIEAEMQRRYEEL